MGSASENIRLARTRAGLEPAAVAAAVGLNKPWYYDVEAYDYEVTDNISLRKLAAIARTLGTTVPEIIDGARTSVPVAKQSLAELARARMASEAMTVDAYSERIGWDIRPVLANPEQVWEYPFCMLAALCADLGADWRAFIEEPVTAT
jgi:transcriptional regulator with XRE-family HTH domain